MHEPIGVIGIVCPDDAPLLGFVSPVAPAIAHGQHRGRGAVRALLRSPPPTSTRSFDTSDVPAGVVNIVTGRAPSWLDMLAAHDDVDALWYFAADDGHRRVERLSAGNMKRTWVSTAPAATGRIPVQGAGEEFLRHATQVKNIWVPYGE